MSTEAISPVAGEFSMILNVVWCVVLLVWFGMLFYAMVWYGRVWYVMILYIRSATPQQRRVLKIKIHLIIYYLLEASKPTDHRRGKPTCSGIDSNSESSVLTRPFLPHISNQNDTKLLTLFILVDENKATKTYK